MADDDIEIDDENSTSEDDTSSDDGSEESSSSAGITPAEMAKKQLRKANKYETAGTVTLVGDTQLVAGVTTDLKKFGSFDKKYIVSKAVHRVSGGYTVEVDLRKCLDGY